MQHEHHHVPVTALGFSGRDVVLAGEGNRLKAYSRSSRKLLAQAQAFDGHAVHGIAVHDGEKGDCDSSTGLIWGGSLIRSFQVDADVTRECYITFGAVQTTDDWILDAAFGSTRSAETPLAAVLTAHNALWLYRSRDESEESERATSLSQVVPGSNCILYSAHVRWLSSLTCLIASGTAFGDIIVWSAVFSCTAGDVSARSQIHYSFSAHQGSIFGGQVSALLQVPGLETKRRLLASCSDDRNIKLWDITELEIESPTLQQLQQDTGFGAKASEGGVGPTCLAKTMGHISRIWHVRFATDEDSALRSILSFGEDGSMIAWDLSLSTTAGKATYGLHKIESTTAHAGKNIWAVAQHSSGQIATGGADGAIVIYNASSSGSVKPSAGEVLNTLLERDNIKTYAFLGHNQCICTTDAGGTVLLDTNLSSSPSLNILSEPLAGLKGYSIVETGANSAFVGGTDGRVYGYHTTSRRVSVVADLNRKIMGLFCNSYVDDSVALLVTAVGGRAAKMYFVCTNNGLAQAGEAVDLVLPQGFVVTSFVAISTPDSFYFVVGSRNGIITLYSWKGRQAEILPSQTYDRVHGKEAVTSLQHVPDAAGCKHSYIASTGRDGTIAMHQLVIDEQASTLSDYDLPMTFPLTESEGDASASRSSLRLELVHQLALPFGPNIEGMHISADDRLWAWGFHSKHFIVYDLFAQREIMSVECGGAHRNWAFQPSEHGGTFVWTKASKVMYTTQAAVPYDIINPGGHGREIKAVAVSPEASKEQIIATGAEDTNLKLFKLVTGGFRCIQTLRKHNTGIQHLQWSRNGQYLFSSGGFEEFFVWRISLGLPYVEVGVVCESKHPRSGSSDLRITGFDVQGTESTSFTITMAYSDSTVKVWQYQDRSWQQLACADYLTACLTHVVLFTSHGNSFATTGTDGHVTLWHSTGSELSWSSRHKVHQNAVHAVIARSLTDGSTLLITGGDDNAIAFTRLGTETCTLRIPRAHAAAVTGLVMLPPADGEGEGKEIFRLASASIDQRVKMWEVTVGCGRDGVEGGDVRMLEDISTAVADVSGLEVGRLEDGGRGLLVTGVGMDLWRIPDLPH